MSNEFTTNRSPVKRDPMSFAEFLFILKIYRRYFYVTTVLAVFATLYSHFSFVPSFVAESRVEIHDEEGGSGAAAKLGIDGPLGSAHGEDLLEKYLTYIKSNEFLMTVAQEVKYKQLNGEGKVRFYREAPKNRMLQFFFSKKDENDLKIDITTLPLEDLAGLIGGMVKYQNSGALTIQIQVATTDQETSVFLANTISQTFIQQVMMRNRQEITEVQNFVAERLQETTEKLKTSEMDLVNYKQKYNIVSAEEGGRLSMNRLGRLDSELEEMKIRIRENERLVELYEKRLAQKDKENLEKTTTADPAEDVNAVRGRIETLRKQQQSLRAMGLRENEGMLNDINRSLMENREKLKSNLLGGYGAIDSNFMSSEEIKEKIVSLKNEIKQINVKVIEVSKAREELQSNMSTLPGREQELQSLERSVALQYELYTLLKKRQQEIEIQKAGLKNPVRISLKSVSANATRPPALALRLLFGVFAGIFMGGVIALGFELSNFTVKHRADLELADLTSLGNIPFVKGKGKKRTGGNYCTDLLVCAKEPDSAESMSFKFLRAQLRNIMSADPNPSKVISVTSSDRADGKSFVSANLAVCFAQMQKKTIVIDADIRNPSIQKYFGFRNEDGLTCLLEMKKSLSEVIIKEKIPCLDILPAGSYDRNPTEVLSSERFSVLIKHLKTKYDYVIIDSPPALFVVDAAIVTSVADTSILVARYRKTKRDALALAHRKILQIAPKTIYGVLNGVQDVHEYVNYRADSYFEKKLNSVRSFMDKKRYSDGSEVQKFGTFLSMEEEKKKKVG